jgi:hypothetical protein
VNTCGSIEEVSHGSFPHVRLLPLSVAINTPFSLGTALVIVEAGGGLTHIRGLTHILRHQR